LKYNNFNIAIEDIKYLERLYKEEPTKGNVWKLAMEGKTLFQIIDIMDVEKGTDYMNKRKESII
jgi:hypothetical protein